jgi:hypothetical protein
MLASSVTSSEDDAEYILDWVIDLMVGWITSEFFDTVAVMELMCL